MSKVNLLPAEVGSLAGELPPAEPGTLFVLGASGGMSVAPDVDFPVIFGRNQPDVHVCVGAGDTHVSRQHGYITRQHSRWVLLNTGRLPIRFPGSRLVLNGGWAELPTGFTPLFIVSPAQEHLLQVRIAAPRAVVDPRQTYEVETRAGKVWALSPEEKLVLVCLGQRYLRHDAQPQPLSWGQVAVELTALCPGEKWSRKRAEHIVTKVRKRLSPEVPGLVEGEVPPPVGNALNHNLIMELLVTTTLTKADLRLLGE